MRNSSEDRPAAQPESLDLMSNLGRRSVLLGMGALAGSVAVPVQAKDRDDQKNKKEANLPDRPDSPRKTKLTEAQWNGKPWIAEKQGNFDLNDRRDNQLATFKITNNLIGKKSYIVMFSRALLGPQGTGGSALYGHMGFWTWQLQVPTKEEFPDAPDGTIVQRAMYTGMILDPITYEPADTIYNQYLDKNVKPVDSLFAESYLFYPEGGTNSVDRANFIQDDPELKKKLRPTLRWGDDIATFLDGIFQSEGPHQPRMDNSIWTSNYADVMNPEVGLVKTDYNFAGIMRAWARPWIGIGKDDDAQVLWNVKGTKMHSADDFPDLVRDNLVAKYPDRV
ncbi:MAG: hypothetical protein AAGE37_00920 [Pseudomonadota bacterium]